MKDKLARQVPQNCDHMYIALMGRALEEGNEKKAFYCGMYTKKGKNYLPLRPPRPPPLLPPPPKSPLAKPPTRDPTTGAIGNGPRRLGPP